MPEEPKAEDQKPETESVPPEAAESQDDAGEFISRQVLDKDTVFFEG